MFRGSFGIQSRTACQVPSIPDFLICLLGRCFASVASKFNIHSLIALIFRVSEKKENALNPGDYFRPQQPNSPTAQQPNSLQTSDLLGQQFGDEAGPAGLVGGTEPLPRIPVEVFVEEDEILPMRILGVAGFRPIEGTHPRLIS